MKIRANNIHIAYDLEGEEDNPVVVLHHSLATNRTMWADLATSLVGEGYRVLRFDARGHGESEAPEGPYDFEMLTRDVTELMKALKIEKAHHVGLSMGGFIGQYLGIYAPSCVQSLVLVSTASELPKGAAALWDERIATVKASGMASQVQPTLERWFTRDFLEGRRDVTDRVAKMIADTPPAGYCGWGEAIKTLNTTSELHKISCPVLVVVGEEDKGTPVSAAELIFEHLPDGALEVYSHVSHMLPLEDDEEFFASVDDFLQEFYEDEDEFPEES